MFQNTKRMFSPGKGGSIEVVRYGVNLPGIFERFSGWGRCDGGRDHVGAVHRQGDRREGLLT